MKCQPQLQREARPPFDNLLDSDQTAKPRYFSLPEPAHAAKVGAKSITRSLLYLSHCEQKRVLRTRNIAVWPFQRLVVARVGLARLSSPAQLYVFISSSWAPAVEGLA